LLTGSITRSAKRRLLKLLDFEVFPAGATRCTDGG